MENYKISFKYNNQEYEADLNNCSATELDKKDIIYLL